MNRIRYYKYNTGVQNKLSIIIIYLAANSLNHVKITWKLH